MNKTASIIIVVALIIGIGIVFWGESKKTTNSTSTAPAENVEIRDGIQYVTIHAKGGYSPKVSTAQANLPTKLIVKTDGTYDCSTALVIRSINYQKVLTPTGEEVIDLGVPQAGALKGLCSMGMYSFSVNFK